MADKSVLRLLDANLNRCREGFRVLEDTARFVRNDERFFLAFRSQRHKLDRLTRRLYPELVAARSGANDAGRTVKEGGRANKDAIIFANFRRCEESLRVLEEYGKLFSAAAGRKFKEMRFTAYELETAAKIKWKLRT
jgi:thiamine-phosphate pyrophosphorylase